MNNKFVLSIVALSFFYCCQNYSADKDIFPENCDLKATFIRYDEIFVPNNIVLLEDYLVLQNGADKIDSFYYVFSYPDIKFLYSFATCGRGPGEYMMPSVIKNNYGNRLAFKDHSQDMIAWYEVGALSAVLVETTSFKSPDGRFFWEINQLNDSLILTKHQNHNDGKTELWDMHNRRCLHSIENTYAHLKEDMGKEYFSIYDDYMLSYIDGKFAIAYYMVDRIEFGQIADGKIVKNSYVGVTSVPDFYRYGYNEKKNFNIDRNTIYYENLYVTTDFVYALYSSKRLDITEKEHSTIIEKYSWSGEPIARYELDCSLAYFAVDEQKHSIYGVNPSMDNVILKYAF